MKQRLLIRAGAISAAVSSLLFLALLAAQDFTIRNDVRLVLLDVGVEKHDGTFLPGLTRQNFEVFENGQPQVVSVFDDRDAPVTLGLLVDESGSMTPRRSLVLTSAGFLINESNRADEVFVLNFNDTVKAGLPGDVLFSSNVRDLRSALYRGKSQGKTALYDAVVEGLERLQAGTRGRKTLVLVSDGGDNASHHTRAEVIDLVQRSAATIYTVGLVTDDYDADPGLLKDLARISGGEADFPKDAPEIEAACHRIAKEIRSRYTIGYVPRDDKGLPALRHVRVRVSGAGVAGPKVFTRTSYRYDQTPEK